MNQFDEALREVRLARGDERAPVRECEWNLEDELLDAAMADEALAREALRQVVEHWPGDLRGVSLKATCPPEADGIRVTLLSSLEPPLGRLLCFTADELRHGSSAVGQRIRREHHEWTEGR